MGEPIADSDLAAPTRRDRVRELRGVVQPARLALRANALRQAPRGDGRAVLVFPGYSANDLALAPLRRYLAAIGHDARGWGLGTNDADFDRLMGGVVALADRVAGETDRRVDIVGWSLGGVLARHVGRETPRSVRQIITFGTPLFGPRHTATARIYDEEEMVRLEAEIRERRRRPITVPITAVHSRNDGVVDWRACIDQWSPNVDNVEVTSPHIAMGLDPDLWLLIADRLQPD